MLTFRSRLARQRCHSSRSHLGGVRQRASASLLARCSKQGSGEQHGRTLSADEWQQKARRNARQEVVSAGARIGLKPAALEQHLDVFESLLPGLVINASQMKASDWARVVSDPDLAAKLITLKTAFPTLNVEGLLGRHPKVLLWSREKLEDNIQHVSPVFAALPRPEVVLSTLPELLEPRQCFSVLASLRKWFPAREPLEVLQSDPDVVRRAEAWDSPLEPVFFDPATRTWSAAGYSRAKQQEWQVYIERELYKRKPQPADKQEALVLGAAGGAPAAAAAAAAGGGEAAGTTAAEAAAAPAPTPGEVIAATTPTAPSA